jgi:hypothetical protein
MASYKSDEISAIVELIIVILLIEKDAEEILLLLVCKDGIDVNETDRIDTNIRIMRFFTWGTGFLRRSPSGRIQKRYET